eukprot:UN31008
MDMQMMPSKTQEVRKTRRSICNTSLIAIAFDNTSRTDLMQPRTRKNSYNNMLMKRLSPSLGANNSSSSIGKISLDAKQVEAKRSSTVRSESCMDVFNGVEEYDGTSTPVLGLGKMSMHSRNSSMSYDRPRKDSVDVFEFNTKESDDAFEFWHRLKISEVKILV